MPVEELSLGALAHGVEAQQDLLQQFRCVELVAVPIVLSVLLLNEVYRGRKGWDSPGA